MMRLVNQASFNLSGAVCALFFAMLSACGGNGAANSPAKHPVTSASDSSPEAALTKDNAKTAAHNMQDNEKAVSFPSSCAKGGDDGLCLPPSHFVKALCASGRVDAALPLFSKGSPWTRRYLRGKVLAWDATGQASDKVQLLAGEEVIVLRHRGAHPGGMVVSGASDGYDVVRWDGTCVSLDGGEIAARSVGRVPHPDLDWRQIDDAAQDALLDDEGVKKAYKERHNECKGVTMGAVSKKCVKAHEHLSKAIVHYVLSGGPLPKPTLDVPQD